MRSHDQYNTTLYSLSDRYRGVFGQRDVVFLNAREMKRSADFAAGDRVDLVTLSTDGKSNAPCAASSVVGYRLLMDAAAPTIPRPIRWCRFTPTIP